MEEGPQILINKIYLKKKIQYNLKIYILNYKLIKSFFFFKKADRRKFLDINYFVGVIVKS